MVRVKFIEALGKKEAADGRRYNVNEIADGIGVSRQTVYLWMNQQLKTVNLDTLDKMCEYLDCDISDLLEYDA